MPCSAQISYSAHAGARGIAMGHSQVCFEDINAIWANQAGLAMNEQTAISIGAQQRYNLTEIGDYSFGFALPTSLGVFGLQIQYFGFDEYSEQKLGLAYARKLSKGLSLGIAIDYISTNTTEFGSKGSFTGEIGVLSRINKSWSVGFHAYNLFRSKISVEGDIPLILKLGTAFKPFEKLNLSLEVEKDIDHDPSFKLGIEYFLLDVLWLRAGATTSANHFTFGLAYTLLQNLTIDAAASYHNLLGFSPAINVSYTFPKKS